MTRTAAVVGLLTLATLVVNVPSSRAAAQDFRALWVDCEGGNRTLWSKAKIVEMLDTAKRIGCTDVFAPGLSRQPVLVPLGEG